MATTRATTTTTMGRECDAAAAAELHADGTTNAAVSTTTHDAATATTALWRVHPAIHGTTTMEPDERAWGTFFLTVRGRCSV